MARTPEENSGNTILRKLIKARKSQIQRLEHEVRQLEIMADKEDARNPPLPFNG